MNNTTDEGLLRDVLDELDRERSKRAKLEEQIQRFEQERVTHALELQGVVSKAEHSKLQTELNGYLDIVNALTERRPALQHRRSGNIPIHILRLLEVMPWDERAQEYSKACDEVYEWQIYRDGAWQSHLHHFPLTFRTMKLAKSSASSAKDNTLLLDLLNVAGSGNQSVLTNENLTRRYDSEVGYAPGGGTWEWIGPWQKSLEFCDAQGWCYAKQPRDFASDNVWDQGGGDRWFRRRQWTRQRVLVDYNDACEPTRQYLKMAAKNAKLEHANNKLSEAVVDPKLSAEAEIFGPKQIVSETPLRSEKSFKTANNFMQQRRKPSDDLTIDESVESYASSQESADKFDWKKLKLKFKAPSTRNIFRKTDHVVVDSLL